MRNLSQQRFAAVAAEHALDVWTKHAGPARPVDVRVTQGQRAAVEAILDCVVLVPDVYEDAPTIVLLWWNHTLMPGRVRAT